MQCYNTFSPHKYLDDTFIFYLSWIQYRTNHCKKSVVLQQIIGFHSEIPSRPWFVGVRRHRWSASTPKPGCRRYRPGFRPGRPFWTNPTASKRQCRQWSCFFPRRILTKGEISFHCWLFIGSYTSKFDLLIRLFKSDCFSTIVVVEFLWKILRF